MKKTLNWQKNYSLPVFSSKKVLKKKLKIQQKKLKIHWKTEKLKINDFWEKFMAFNFQWKLNSFKNWKMEFATKNGFSKIEKLNLNEMWIFLNTDKLNYQPWGSFHDTLVIYLV
jgi:hypothetical protein